MQMIGVRFSNPKDEDILASVNGKNVFLSIPRLVPNEQELVENFYRESCYNAALEKIYGCKVESVLSLLKRANELYPNDMEETLKKYILEKLKMIETCSAVFVIDKEVTEMEIDIAYAKAKGIPVVYADSCVITFDQVIGGDSNA